jgi:chorismate--pyruvate lyase
VKTRSRHIPVRALWLTAPAGAGAYRHWLQDPGSLTQRLQLRCPAFSVERLHQRWARPQLDEALLLGLPLREHAWLREVTLCCNGTPVVFAHSVLPRSSLRGEWRGLGRLGSRPLGAALFSNPQVLRTPLAYRKLTPAHTLYRRAATVLAVRPACLWARRSVFWLCSAPILVTEVFLPDVLTL